VTTNRGYLGVPEMEANEREHRRKIARAVNNILSGRVNATVEVTLRASQTTTTLTDPRISATSFIDFMPLTANALTAKANLRVSAQQSGEATLTHASSANTDQQFRVLVIG
jgi:hypothetical protein